MQGPQHGSTWVPWVRLIQGWPKMELEEERKGAHGAPGACPDRENGSHAGSPHGVPAPHEGTPTPACPSFQTSVYIFCQAILRKNFLPFKMEGVHRQT